MSTPIFDRILIVMFENQYRSYVMQDPFMQKLASAGCNMTNYFGAFHPSQTNYIASTAGEICSVTNDTPPVTALPQQNIVDLLEARNVSWKAYMEGYPNEPWDAGWTANPSTGHPIDESPAAPDLAYYFRKHNPFASFQTIQASPERWAKIVDENAFWADVTAGNLPDYSWFTPDIWNDGHYLYNTHIDTDPRTQLVPQMSAWLEHVFLGDIEVEKLQGATAPPSVNGKGSGKSKLGLNLDVDLLLTDPQTAYANSNIPSNTLVVVTFDEADYDASGYDTNYDGPNQIYTVLLGDMIEPGSSDAVPYNHYNLIRTIEKNFGLGSLGKNDRGANWFRKLWNQQFAWEKPSSTGLTGNGRAALANLDGATWLVYADASDQLNAMAYANGSWSAPSKLGFSASGAIAMTAIADRLELLFVADAEGSIQRATMQAQTGWSSAESTGLKSGGDIAVLCYEDFADNSDKLMLVWQSADNEYMNWIQGDASGWSSDVQALGQLTDGPITLAQLGGAIFAVYKERRTSGMRVCSFNTAPFNAFDAQTFDDKPAPENNTTLHQWSVQDFPVGNFAKKFAALKNDYLASGPFAMASANGEIRLIHRAPYADTPQVNHATFGLTGIYSAASQQTNGYGTIDQAGWTQEETLAAVNAKQNGAMAICAQDDGSLLYVYEDETSGKLMFGSGGYRSC